METGGTEKVTNLIINELVKRNYVVNLICLKKKGFFLDSLAISEDSIFEIGTATTAKGILSLKKKLDKILYITKTETLFCMGEYPNIIGPLTHYKCKKIIVEHNIKTFFTSPDSFSLSFSMKLLSYKSYLKAEKILCVSQNIRDLIILKNKQLSSRTYTIYNPFDFEKIALLSKEPLNYETDNIKILCLGRLTAQKNHILLLDAFKTINDKYNNTELWIVGDGELSQQIKNYCHSLNLDKSVIFWGIQNNPYKLISKSDFLVSSSNYEGFPLVIIEALSLNTRVVVTRSISDFDQLISSDIGRVVETNNKQSLIEAIEKEIQEKRTITTTPEILKQFSLSNIVDKYLEYS